MFLSTITVQSILALGFFLLPTAKADITWPLYSQQCRDDAGPPYSDDGVGKYHDGSAAYPQLLSDGKCAKPMQEACASRPTFKTAYLEGPVGCDGNGWYCRIFDDEANGWNNVNLKGDLNFGSCNSTDAFEDAGSDPDGHCHGSADDSTYYWWIRDHFFRQYNGRVRCCCGWNDEGGSQPLLGRRIANRCDYRRLVTDIEDVTQCRDANEEHGLGFEDGCDPQFQESQLNKPIPEDDDVCWEIQRFGFTEEGGSVPTGSPDTSSTSAPIVSPTSSAPVASPTIFDPPVAAPVVSPTTTLAPVAAPTDGEEDDIACIDSPLKFIFKKIPRNCVWASKGNSVKRCAKKGVSAHCPSTCGTCEEKKCSDSGRKFVLENGTKKGCGFFARNTDRCDKFDNAVETCRDSCGYCDYYDGEE